MGEVAEAARVLAGRVPEPLGGLAELAFTIVGPGRGAVRSCLSGSILGVGRGVRQNPVRMLEEVSPSGLERLAGDRDFLERLEAVSGEVRRDGASVAYGCGRS